MDGRLILIAALGACTHEGAFSFVVDPEVSPKNAAVLARVATQASAFLPDEIRGRLQGRVTISLLDDPEPLAPDCGDGSGSSRVTRGGVRLHPALVEQLDRPCARRLLRSALLSAVADIYDRSDFRGGEERAYLHACAVRAAQGEDDGCALAEVLSGRERVISDLPRWQYLTDATPEKTASARFARHFADWRLDPEYSCRHPRTADFLARHFGISEVSSCPSSTGAPPSMPQRDEPWTHEVSLAPILPWATGGIFYR